MKYIDLLVERLKERNSQTVDMVSWYNFTTWDIISDLAFGEPFGCLNESRFHPWISTIFHGLQTFAIIQAVHQFDWIFPLLKKLIPASLKEMHYEHFRFADEKVERRLAKGSNTDHNDFWTYILKFNDTKYRLSMGEMQSNSAVLVTGGSETIATLLSGTTYYLLKNPEKLEKLTKEIRSAFKAEKEIDFKSVSELRYLIACLEEGLRIYPPVPTGLPRRVPAGGETIAGHFIPERVHFLLQPRNSSHYIY
jgi:cytochrome P450